MDFDLKIFFLENKITFHLETKTKHFLYLDTVYVLYGIWGLWWLCWLYCRADEILEISLYFTTCIKIYLKTEKKQQKQKNMWWLTESGQTSLF